MSQEAFGKHRGGFTIIEFLVVMSIFIISVATVFPFLESFHQSERVGTTIIELNDTIRRAQNRAMTGQRNAAWGVRMQTGSFVLFAGNAYADRSAEFDEVHTVPPSSIFSGSGEVVFVQYSGKPLSSISITLSSQNLSRTGSVVVNAAGSITRMLPNISDS